MGGGAHPLPLGGAGGAEPMELALPTNETRVPRILCLELEVELFGWLY